jgi:hypothetical protein
LHDDFAVLGRIAFGECGQARHHQRRCRLDARAPLRKRRRFARARVQSARRAGVSFGDRGRLLGGGQYGEGALRVGGRTVGFYSTAAGSFGLQIGAQSKALVFLFMTQESLDEFLSSQGWAVGANATVAVLKVGANGAIDSSTATSPVQAFVLTNAGLMAGISLEGTKVSRLLI